MGLFDGLRSLFGTGDGGHGESAATRATGALSSGGGGPNQRHGSHWDTVLDDDGSRPEPIAATLEYAMEHGNHVDSRRDDVSGIRYDEGPATVWMALESRGRQRGEIVSAYPGVVGTDQTLAVHELLEWADGMEAGVEADLGPATVSAFLTNFFEREREAFGGECEASVAALLYDGGPHESGTVSLAGGDSRDLGEAAALNETEGGAPDDYYVQTVVEDVERIRGEVFDGYLLEAPFFRMRWEGVDVPGTLFLGSHVAGEYEPEVGDAIEGVGWLQARFM